MRTKPLVLAGVLGSSTAFAQSTSTSTPVRSLLYWLDEAEVVEPGGIDVSAAAGLTKLPSGHEVDAPSIFVAVGVAPRVQVAASGFYYALSYSDGFSSSRRGDTYLMGKVAVVSPREHSALDNSVGTRHSAIGRHSRLAATEYPYRTPASPSSRLSSAPSRSFFASWARGLARRRQESRGRWRGAA